jgi:hypothetical protein
MANLPGKELAQELLDQSRAESRNSPMEEVIAAARERRLKDDSLFRLLGRLWTLERLFYYVYGGWGQGLEIGDTPPSAKYLFSRQIMDESTHEMLYLDMLLRKGWLATQKDAFRHPYSKFTLDSALAYYTFALRNLATYPHPVRIAGLNLGAKVIESGWMEALAAVFEDGELRNLFSSQLVENRSHINMGRRIVEECIGQPFQAELCRWASRSVKRDYTVFLQELADFVLDRPSRIEARSPIRVND